MTERIRQWLARAAKWECVACPSGGHTDECRDAHQALVDFHAMADVVEKASRLVTSMRPRLPSETWSREQCDLVDAVDIVRGRS